MSATECLTMALGGLDPKPPEDSSRSTKKRYSEKMSAAIALAVADSLRQKGCDEARPTDPGITGDSGAERRLAGGIGAKKVDVTWATEESGLLLSFSVKTINWRDRRTSNFQKNLVNRRGDMLMEAVTLHRRFPYAVIGGLLFLDHEAALDGTERRLSTFANAHPRLRLFSGRSDPSGRDEQFEGLYIALVDANPFMSKAQLFEAGYPKTALTFDEVIDRMLRLVAERNFDFYEHVEGAGIRKL